ncbi:hypothetical protein ACQP2F_34360 [Actinoplanes sp. CA-030573]|uniref:hypothetical protein n=1 Tax=Actinoplanes sp. CA-030573 TaxID=3239898 RepID=UPI003D8A8726
MKRKLIAFTAVLVTLLAAPFAPSVAANAAPSGGQSAATVADILRMNPNAKQIAPNVVNVAPNVDLVVPAKAAAGLATDSTYAQCSYQYLCVFEAAVGIGLNGGYALRFSACTSYNLGYYSYPDFRYVGTAAGPKWNDRISAVFDNQTSGANYASFYNWTGSAWQFRFGPGHQIIFPYVGDYNNDTFDRVDVC